MRILITGGAGFIGVNLIRLILDRSAHTVLNIDKLCFPGSIHTVRQFEGSNRYQFMRADICDSHALRQAFDAFRPDAVMHLAAESHVDRSIDNPDNFIQSNIIGTYRLLETALQYWRRLDSAAGENFRFHHISTDEVYGSLKPRDPEFSETTAYDPSSPYSASKAASDHLAMAWHKTYGLPVVLSNCGNNYGPYQFPEKLIPLMILKALNGESMPVYGQGANIRDWLYVVDHADALIKVLEQGQLGESYNIGGRSEIDNISLIKLLCGVLDELLPESNHRPHANLISFVTDRPGHDYRYAINTDKIVTQLGWKPRYDLENGLRETVSWYLDNLTWCEQVMENIYQGQRLGLGER